MRRLALAALGLLLAAPQTVFAQSQAQPPVAIEEQRTITIIPADQFAAMQQQAGTDHDRLWVAVPFDNYNALRSGSTSAMSTTPPPGPAVSSSASRPLASYIGPDKVLVVVPRDQIHAFRSATTNQHDVTVLMPYDQYRQLANNITTSPTGRERAGFQGSSSDQSAWQSSRDLTTPFFRGDQVLLIVPTSDLKNFNTANCTNCQQPLVVMPLDQFNRMAEISSAGPVRERTAYVAPAPAYQEQHRLVGLPPAGEATAINQIFPVAGGRLLVLNDGEVLLLPDSVTVDGGSALEIGTNVRGQYEDINGQKLITWLSVDESQGSHHESGNSGGGS